ncbi:MAG: family lipolytic protein [Myxococcaceae bacterium]|nr:family lipolytic protein [Myxococcaceae bacterium]
MAGFVLLVSVGLAIYFAHASNEHFKMSNELRLDPAGLAVYAAERAAPPPPADRPVLLFYGDSRALMWTPTKDLPDWNIVDRGVGYQTTAQILLRFDTDVPLLHPAVVVLEAGVNDLKALVAFPERRAEIISTCVKNLTLLVARSRALGATVVLTTVFAMGDVSLLRRLQWSDDVAVAVREVNGHIRKMAADKVIVFDADPVLDEGDKIRPAFQHDFIHISPAGYAALNERLVPIVRGLR